MGNQAADHVGQKNYILSSLCTVDWIPKTSSKPYYFKSFPNLTPRHRPKFLFLSQSFHICLAYPACGIRRSNNSLPLHCSQSTLFPHRAGKQDLLSGIGLLKLASGQVTQRNARVFSLPPIHLVTT
jgi:hypothetical protein